VQSWLVFWTSLFWISLFLFFFNKTNFLDLLLFSEIVWVILYILTIFYGSITDDINLYSLSFLILALAGLEFCIGLLLLVFFKNNKIDFNFTKNNNTWIFSFLKNSNKPLYFNKFFKN
jgi:NADH:ubiquinone oxidoreductase subunit K